MGRDIACFAVFHPESIFKYPNPNPNTHTHTHTHTHIHTHRHKYPPLHTQHTHHRQLWSHFRGPNAKTLLWKQTEEIKTRLGETISTDR